MKALIAGNWKMNGLRAALSEIDALKGSLQSAPSSAEVLVCPPATLISDCAEKLGAVAGTGGQDCHAEASGAFTGDLSAAMLKEAGASYVIVGHSERRAGHGETDAIVHAKAEAALKAGLRPIVAIGETREEREAGEAIAVLERQLAGSRPQTADFDLAYEPVWAIGTGLTPSISDIAEAHAALRAALVGHYGEAGRAIRILYGGSVKPANAEEILAVEDVNGALVGGASLKAEDFLGIIRAA